jgi:PLD-like domain
MSSTRSLTILGMLACSCSPSQDAGIAIDSGASDLAVDSPGASGDVRIWSQFNWPRAHGGSDRTIESELVRMIAATPPAAVIRGNFYLLESAGIASALNAAYDRGVTMRISLDGSPRNRAAAPARLVASHMGTSAGYCGGTDPTAGTVGCITSAVGGIAHVKFLTFSQTEAPDGTPYRDVVWFSSFNASEQSGNLDSNSATSVYNSSVSYNALSLHQVRMQAQRHYPENDYYDPEPASLGHVHDAEARVEFHLSPEHDANLVLAQFERVIPDPSCVIRVFQAVISDSMLPTVEKLVALQGRSGGVRRGCQVFVLADVVQPRCLATLRAAEIEVRAITGVHDKQFMIDARYDGSAERRQLVFTGSHNWSTKASYGNDELLASIEDPAQYTLYYAHFLDGWHAAQ